jgi:hypothetical protein
MCFLRLCTVNCLEKHQFGAFDQLFELLDPLSTEGTVNDSMVT